jgi:hypothetical protein
MASTEQDTRPTPTFCRVCAGPLADGQCRSRRRKHRIMNALLLGISMLAAFVLVYIAILRLR